MDWWDGQGTEDLPGSEEKLNGEVGAGDGLVVENVELVEGGTYLQRLDELCFPAGVPLALEIGHELMSSIQFLRVFFRPITDSHQTLPAPGQLLVGVLISRGQLQGCSDLFVCMGPGYHRNFDGGFVLELFKIDFLTDVVHFLYFTNRFSSFAKVATYRLYEQCGFCRGTVVSFDGHLRLVRRNFEQILFESDITIKVVLDNLDRSHAVFPAQHLRFLFVE